MNRFSLLDKPRIFLLVLLASLVTGADRVQASPFQEKSVRQEYRLLPIPRLPPPASHLPPSPIAFAEAPPNIFSRNENVVNKELDESEGWQENVEGEGFFLKTIVVTGNTVLHAEIAEIVRSLENREIVFEDLLRARAAITELYVRNGYITSGAFLPDHQDITSGVVRIQVIEGEIERVDVTVSGRLRPGYIEERVRLGIGKPFNQKDLRSALEVLQLNALIERVNAELIPGTTAGKNILQVKVQEAPAFHAGIGIDNYRPPSIGSDQATIFLSHDNLFGFGDRLSGQYWLSEGLNLYDISYEIPINALDGTVKARYWNSNNVVIESFLQEFEIENQSDNLSFSVRQPIFRSTRNEFALDFSFDLRRSRSSLLDEDFCFSSPCRDGKTNLTILRFAQEWVNRSPIDVMAVQSRFSFGVAG